MTFTLVITLTRATITMTTTRLVSVSAPVTFYPLWWVPGCPPYPPPLSLRICPKHPHLESPPKTWPPSECLKSSHLVRVEATMKSTYINLLFIFLFPANIYIIIYMYIYSPYLQYSLVWLVVCCCTQVPRLIPGRALKTRREACPLLTARPPTGTWRGQYTSIRLILMTCSITPSHSCNLIHLLFSVIYHHLCLSLHKSTCTDNSRQTPGLHNRSHRHGYKWSQLPDICTNGNCLAVLKTLQRMGELIKLTSSRFPLVKGQGCPPYPRVPSQVIGQLCHLLAVTSVSGWPPSPPPITAPPKLLCPSWAPRVQPKSHKWRNGPWTAESIVCSIDWQATCCECKER